MCLPRIIFERTNFGTLFIKTDCMSDLYWDHTYLICLLGVTVWLSFFLMGFHTVSIKLSFYCYGKLKYEEIDFNF